VEIAGQRGRKLTSDPDCNLTGKIGVPLLYDRTVLGEGLKTYTFFSISDPVCNLIGRIRFIITGPGWPDVFYVRFDNVVIVPI
jgi:hypothetical protein